MAKKKKTTLEELVKYYMEYRLEHGENKVSEYHFCKAYNLEEGAFYKLTPSLKKLSELVYLMMHDPCLELLVQDESFETYSKENKVLSYFYTLFEIFTANRSFILMDLSSMQVTKLKLLKQGFQDFIKSLHLEPLDIKEKRIQQIQSKSVEELYFVQLISAIKFWIEDESLGFEKTDLYIEKSVKAGFEISKTLEMKEVLDFGKFMFKETFKNFSL